MLLILLINLALVSFIFIFFKNKLSNGAGWLLKHMGLLEAAWTGFLFLLGLFILFDIMEAKQDNERFLTLATQERMIQVSLLFGFGIIHLSILVIIIIKFLKKSFTK